MLVWLLAACTLAATPTDPPPSSWGRTRVFAQAEQSHAPALWTTQERVTAAWVGRDPAADDPQAAGIVQQALALESGFTAADQRLPLPPVYPYDQRLTPALRPGYLHLTWLDSAYNDVAAGTRLWTVVLTPDLIPTRGAVQITEVLTTRYALLPAEDGALWVVWSGGLRAEPALYAQFIDPAGRPRAERRLTAAGDWPALVRDAAGGATLFWLRYGDLHVFRAGLMDDTLTALTPLLASPRLAPGDRLVGFSAGLDSTHAYLFWNIQRLNGANETWFATGRLAADDLDGLPWADAVRLGIASEAVLHAAPDAPFVTGFNGGDAQVVTEGERWAAWAVPLAGQEPALAVAAEVDSVLCVVYLRGGAVAAVQPVAALDHPLLGSPALHADRDRHLTLAWAQPRRTSRGAVADLLWTTTRP